MKPSHKQFWLASTSNNFWFDVKYIQGFFAVIARSPFLFLIFSVVVNNLLISFLKLGEKNVFKNLEL